MARIYDTTEPTDLLAGIRAARAALARGEAIVVPTDTVYGIAADAFSPLGVARLLAIKGRSRATPPPVLVADVSTMDALAAEIPEIVRELLERHSPGALTVVLPARSSLSWDLGDTNGTVALRVPDHAMARELLRETGPLAVSSANRHGEPAATTAAEADAALGNDLEVVLDAGPGGGEASTIVDATPLTRPAADGETPRAVILRQGALSREAIAEVLGDALAPEASEEG